MTKSVIRNRKLNRAAMIGRWEEVAPSLLKEAARRVRSHPLHKRKMVQASIETNVILTPVIVNSSNVIVDGHLRVEIATKLGLSAVPVVRVEHLSDTELRAYALAANKLPSVANYDNDALRLEFEEMVADVPTLDLSTTGFTIGEVDRITDNHDASMFDDLDDDAPIVATKQSKSKVGDLVQLGSHRLICGNALDPEVMKQVMGEDKARVMFTDPPYNVKINGHVSGSGKHDEFAMASGEMSSSQFTEFLQKAFEVAGLHLKDGAIAFICMDHAHLGELMDTAGRIFTERLNICVWDKGQGGMGALYRSRHELLEVYKFSKAQHLNNIMLGKNGRDRSNIWSYPGMAGFSKSKKKALDLHPTVKPVALIANAILDVSAPGDIVLDSFGGSGSTLIAAEKLDRQARLIELDPDYVDRIIERWESLTKQKAVLLNEVVAPEKAEVKKKRRQSTRERTTSTTKKSTPSGGRTHE